MAQNDVYTVNTAEDAIEIYLQGGARKNKARDILLAVAPDQDSADFVEMAINLAMWCECTPETLKANQEAGKSNLLAGEDDE